MHETVPSSASTGPSASATALRVRLRGALDQAPDPQLVPGDRLAAVLALLVASPELSLVFARRSDALPRHPGEISFPGGIVHPEDVDLAATALREAQEEVGLDPALPELLGALAPVHTTVSGILVVPFVGMVDAPPALSIGDGEIVEVEAEVEWERPDGRRWRGWVYELDGRTIWGATGSMLRGLLQILRKEMA